MSERNLKLMDIRELLLHIQAQSSDRQVARDTGLNRRTVKRYREWAQGQGLLERELPALEELQVRLTTSLPERTPPQNHSSLDDNGVGHVFLLILDGGTPNFQGKRGLWLCFC